MSQNTKIEWATHTFNPWRGCTKISPGCKNCYAERLDKRRLWNDETAWGDAAPRFVNSEMQWKLPRTWDRAAAKSGDQPRVFCGSVCDVGEDRPDLVEPRRRLVDVIRMTRALRWLLLSKRPQSFRRLFDWPYGLPPPNVWAMTSVEDQAAADERIPHLRSVPASVRGLSVEPLLERVDLGLMRQSCPFCADVDSEPGWAGAREFWCDACGDAGWLHPIDWVIVGGESQGRPCAVEWIADVVAQCRAAAVPVFVKQLGSKPTLNGAPWKVSGKGGEVGEWPMGFGLVNADGSAVRELPEAT